MEPIEIDIDISEGEQTLEEFQNKIDEVVEDSNEKLAEVEERSGETFDKVLQMARGAYLLTLGMVKTTGTSITYFFRSMISAAFSTAAVLKPLILAKAMTTGDWISAGISLASLATSIMAALAAQHEAEDIARGLRGIDMTLLGIQQLIGQLNFF